MPGQLVLATPRLVLRRLTPSDAPLIHELFTDPDFLRHVGDRGVRTVGDAERFLAEGPIPGYERLGFGPWRVELAPSGEATGICGLLRRDYLPAPDLGFAILARHRAAGYATEAARGVLAHAHEALGIKEILAITSPDNDVSGRILRRIGFVAAGTVREPRSGEVLRLFAATRRGA